MTGYSSSAHYLFLPAVTVAFDALPKNCETGNRLSVLLHNSCFFFFPAFLFFSLQVTPSVYSQRDATGSASQPRTAEHEQYTAIKSKYKSSVLTPKSNKTLFFVVVNLR